MALDADTAKKVAAAIKDAKLKKVQASIQGDQVRVTSPSRDDLGAVRLKLAACRLPSARPSAGAHVHFGAVFDALSDRLQATLGDLGRARRLDEDAVNKAMREIRLALLEADVNFQVVKDFVARSRRTPSARTSSRASIRASRSSSSCTTSSRS